MNLFKKYQTFNIVKIQGFNYISFLAINPHINKLLKNNIYKDLDDYLVKVGLNKIKQGEIKFHQDFNTFDEKIYLQFSPDIFQAIKNKEFDSAFHHFCLYGYTEIINKSRMYTPSHSLPLSPQSHINKPIGSKSLNLLKDKAKYNNIETTTDDIINKFINIQSYLKNKQPNQISNASTIIQEKIIPKILQELRLNYNKDSFKVKIPFKDRYSFSKHSSKTAKIVDIIIPIYSNIEITQNTIESVIKAKGIVDYHLILINDKSPETLMCTMLEQYMNHNNITLINNIENLGFIFSANLGMSLHNRDVILLNSDTVVTDFWLDKLQHTAYIAKNVATVTPMSNNASILSYPEMLINNEIPNNMSVDELNLIFEKVNNNLSIEIPTAHGFCMFIKREAILNLGYFDEKKYGKGYGEENDFSMKATSKGWKNLVSCNTFIEHFGSISFGDNREKLIKNNLNILHKSYPDYPHLINKFIDDNPLKIARRNVSREILKTNSSRYILFVMHSLGGGTELASQELASLLLDEGESVLVLTHKANEFHISGYNHPFLLEYNVNEWKELINDLIKLNIWHIHYHHILQFKWDILQLPYILQVSYDFTVHDYMAICPRITLIDESLEYCGEPTTEICNKCIEYNGTYTYLENKYQSVDNDISKWRDKFKLFLENAEHVFFPNEDVLRRLKKYFNLNNSIVNPHPEVQKEIKFEVKKHDTKKVKVAIIGAINQSKGFSRLQQSIHHAWKYSLPIDFIIIGHTINDGILENYSNTTILGKYSQDDLPSLITKYNCSIALFLSVWPETFSYTLSEALANKLFPISYDIGALSTRIKKLKIGKVIPFNASAELLNKTILEIYSKETIISQQIGYTYDSIIRDYYKFNNN